MPIFAKRKYGYMDKAKALIALIFGMAAVIAFVVAVVSYGKENATVCFWAIVVSVFSAFLALFIPVFITFLGKGSGLGSEFPGSSLDGYC